MVHFWGDPQARHPRSKILSQPLQAIHSTLFPQNSNFHQAPLQSTTTLGPPRTQISRPIRSLQTPIARPSVTFRANATPNKSYPVAMILANLLQVVFSALLWVLFSADRALASLQICVSSPFSEKTSTFTHKCGRNSQTSRRSQPKQYVWKRRFCSMLQRKPKHCTCCAHRLKTFELTDYRVYSTSILASNAPIFFPSKPVWGKVTSEERSTPHPR